MTVKPDGRVLLHCHANCTHEAVLDAYGLVTDVDLAPTTSASSNGSVPAIYYEYKTTPLMRVVRTFPQGLL